MVTMQFINGSSDDLHVGSVVRWGNYATSESIIYAIDIVAFIERDDDKRITKIAFATCQKIFTFRNRNLKIFVNTKTAAFSNISDDEMLGKWYRSMSKKKAIKVKDGFNVID